MKKQLSSLVFAITAIISSFSVAETPVELTVYTTFETDLLARYKKTFESENPDIKIRWVRDSIGIMTAKLLAEKNNSQADVVWGLAGSSMALLKNEGILETYRPAGIEQTKTTLNDPEPNQAWFGNQVAVNVICFNEAVAKAQNLPKPESWDDLLNPVYQGKIAMPNPASSGTGYMQVFNWLQSKGESKAWDYMAKLHNNISQYTHSGSKPCVQAAMGEVAIGISIAIRGVQLKAQGAPLALILPKDGVGWDVDSVGLLKKGTHKTAARKLVDWTISRQANEQYAQTYAVVGHKQVRPVIPNYPDVEEVMKPVDFSTMARKRSEILKAWSDLFDHKSASTS